MVAIVAPATIRERPASGSGFRGRRRITKARLNAAHSSQRDEFHH
jgi:hypothetical protein